MYQTALNVKIFESFDGNALNIYIDVCVYIEYSISKVQSKDIRTLSICVCNFFDKRIFRASRHILLPWIQTCLWKWKRYPLTKIV